jgi:FkbM family methyltransferase
MIKFKIVDFIPPILTKGLNYLFRKFFLRNNILHPFTEIKVPDSQELWIMDIGANIGDVARRALLSFPRSKVVCFEPVDSTREILKQNLNEFKERVSYYSFALSDSDTLGTINLTSFHGANSILPQSNSHKVNNPHVKEVSTQDIQLMKIDSILDILPSKYFDIVKIDVEGFELNVLNGGEFFFRNCVNCVMIEISFMRDEDLKSQSIFKIFNTLHTYGFYLYNMYDIHKFENYDPSIRLVQFDCIFQKY